MSGHHFDEVSSLLPKEGTPQQAAHAFSFTTAVLFTINYMVGTGRQHSTTSSGSF
jgi:hypothetical protein